MGQTKARCAANGCSIGKQRNEGMAHVQGFPSGEPLDGHLLRCAFLQWNNHCGKERALHMTTWRLAVARLVCKGQAKRWIRSAASLQTGQPKLNTSIFCLILMLLPPYMSQV